jgi:hypothetical protein
LRTSKTKEDRAKQLAQLILKQKESELLVINLQDDLEESKEPKDHSRVPASPSKGSLTTYRAKDRAAKIIPARVFDHAMNHYDTKKKFKV